MARSYSEQEKAGAVEALRDASKSYATLRDELGIPIGTLGRWAKEAGVERSEGQKQMADANEARRIRIENRRGRLKEKLLRHAETFVDVALDHSKGARRMEGGVFVPMAKDVKDMMTAAAIALDKFRLEMGEATQVTRHEVPPVAEEAKAKLDELAARRAQQKSA